MSGDVFDLDALTAEEAGEPFRFRFGGEMYELPARVDLRMALALEAGRLGETLERLLGPDQWERLQASPAVLDGPAFQALLVKYLGAQGMTVGESSASSASSGSTVKPLRPTSNGSTRSVSLP